MASPQPRTVVDCSTMPFFFVCVPNHSENIIYAWRKRFKSFWITSAELYTSEVLAENTWWSSKRKKKISYFVGIPFFFFFCYRFLFFFACRLQIIVLNSTNTHLSFATPNHHVDLICSVLD